MRGFVPIAQFTIFINFLLFLCHFLAIPKSLEFIALQFNKIRFLASRMIATKSAIGGTCKRKWTCRLHKPTPDLSLSAIAEELSRPALFTSHCKLCKIERNSNEKSRLIEIDAMSFMCACSELPRNEKLTSSCWNWNNKEILNILSWSQILRKFKWKYLRNWIFVESENSQKTSCARS